MIKKAYKYRFYPTSEQEILLAKTFGCTRYVYNWALSVRKEAYEKDKTVINYGHTSALLTQLKKENETDWLNEVSCVPLQQALRHLQTAYKNFFSGFSEYPSFKKRNSKQSAEFTKSAFKWKNGDLYLPKLKEPLKIRWTREIPSPPSTITITRDTAGRFFVVFLCETNIATLPVIDKTVGLDLGVGSMVVCDDGWKSGNPKYTQRYEKKLSKAQKNLSRKKLGSKNRHKAKLKVAKIHAKITDSRKDFTHKLSKKLINENQVISIESLKVKNMLKNRHLAKAISDCNWGELVRQLRYKSEWYGRDLVAIDQWFPSSKTCSFCGYKLDKLDLSTRHWSCPECESLHDRDHNAAKNIKAAGLAVLASGENVILT